MKKEFYERKCMVNMVARLHNYSLPAIKMFYIPNIIQFICLNVTVWRLG